MYLWKSLHDSQRASDENQFDMFIGTTQPHSNSVQTSIDKNTLEYVKNDHVENKNILKRTLK